MFSSPYQTLVSSALVFLLLLCACYVMADSSYQSSDAYLEEVFFDDVPTSQVIWLKGEVKDTVADILGHRYPGIRIRYWGKDRRTAWVLEEVGKTQPITVGLVVNAEGLNQYAYWPFVKAGVGKSAIRSSPISFPAPG